ncbi:MAG: DegT/DnrJ/EryC1/StrS family aminotransferase, partial [Chloroflexi bacterium]|nr:DegT/DnrJ/EryC1/StrS family aminotransferase [Chloroflexota bacterium]
NNGPFHTKLEKALCEYLGVDHLSLFTNGTIALVTALQTLRITGEVITTPYSFVATTHSLLWNNLKPVFVDIDPVTMNLNAEMIESAITQHTSAIMPVHCYGHPCDVDRIQEIADKHGLQIIYDAAHAFGIRYKGQSLLSYGDLSVLSFHATKVFNTFEGGAIICPDSETKRRIDYLKNFGIADEVTVVEPGINGKMNELQAAFGLLQLEYVETIKRKRQAVDKHYREALLGVNGIAMPFPTADFDHNYSHFPILVNPGYVMDRDQLYQRLRAARIHARRYFYPLISDLPMYCDLASAEISNLPVAKSIAKRILCLPIYPDLSWDSQQKVINIVSGKV